MRQTRLFVQKWSVRQFKHPTAYLLTYLLHEAESFLRS